MTNTMDITGTSDTVLDAAIALRTGDAEYDFDALTYRELVEVQAVTGVSLSGWIAVARRAADVQSHVSRRDYEGAILARQEDDGRNVG